MGIYKAEAIIVRSRVYGEADSILTLFTRESGKVSAIAKGVRKPSSRLRGAVQLFSHTNLVLYTGKSLDNISQGEAEESFSYLEGDLDRLATASYCAELVDRLTMERQPFPRIFQLLLSVLQSLATSDAELLARFFEVQLLAVLGYRPQLDGCVQGEHRPDLVAESQTGGPVWFSVERGGVLCPTCAAKTPGAIPLSPATVGVLEYFLRSTLEQASKVKLGSRNSRELAGLLRSFLIYHCDIKPRSWEFLDTLRRDHDAERQRWSDPGHRKPV